MPTFAATQAGYRNMWDRATILPEKVAAAKLLAAKIVAHKVVYQEIEAATGVPWFMIGCIHLRESDLDFGTYLGNGDSLSRPTVNVPAGRGPFKSFLLGAIDALVFQGFTLIKAWTGEHVLYGWEEFNGEGYEKFHNENSPYLWAWTTLQQLGKYTSDGGFDPNVLDTQPGCVAVLKAICLLDPTVNAFMNPAGAVPAKPKEPTVAAPAPVTPALTVDWHLLLSGVELQLPTLISAVPALAPFKNLIVSGSKVLLHANPATMQGEALSLVIDQGLPLLAQFFPQVSPFIGMIQMLAKMLLHATPPAAPTPAQQAVTFQASTGAS